MKILTLNTWQERGPWRDRWKLIFAGLRSHSPDVVLFQEVFNPCWAQKVKQMSGYRHLVFPRESGGLMILSKHPVTHWERITYKEKAPTENYYRYALFAKIRIGAQEAAFFNTHLSWRIPETQIRSRQIGELLVYINKKAGKLPVFAAGDFNAHEKAPEIQRMVREGRFTDVYAARNAGNAGLTWNNKNPFTAGASVRMPDRRIDFIWMRDPAKIFKIRSAELIYERPHGGLYASDHAGVLAELVISKKIQETE